MKTTTIPALLTVDQCAEIMQCSVSMVERLIRTGELKRVKLTSREVRDPGKRGPKNWRVRPETLDQFIKDREAAERPRHADTPAAAEPPKIVPMGTGTDGKTRARIPKHAR